MPYILRSLVCVLFVSSSFAGQNFEELEAFYRETLNQHEIELSQKYRTALERLKSREMRSDNLEAAVKINNRIDELKAREADLLGGDNTAKRQAEQRPAATEPTRKPPYVPSEAEFCDGSWFHIYWEPGSNVQEVEKRCKKMKGRLAVIHNENRNQFIQHKVVTDPDTLHKVYIGLNDSEQEGDWRWSDGSKLDYANWRAGEPNNHGGHEDYTVMHAEGKWNDVPGSHPWRVGFVCEWPVEP